MMKRYDQEMDRTMRFFCVFTLIGLLGVAQGPASRLGPSSDVGAGATKNGVAIALSLESSSITPVSIPLTVEIRNVSQSVVRISLLGKEFDYVFHLIDLTSGKEVQKLEKPRSQAGEYHGGPSRGSITKPGFSHAVHFNVADFYPPLDPGDYELTVSTSIDMAQSGSKSLIRVQLPESNKVRFHVTS